MPVVRGCSSVSPLAPQSRDRSRGTTRFAWAKRLVGFAKPVAPPAALAHLPTDGRRVKRAGCFSQCRSERTDNQMYVIFSHPGP